ncbi:hypothetical protein QAD02_011015 [Eretmocerus hayati]|uniref:Uncharacterized protein n=1 Tax=Eretmocerus hayati TaxID=131215 RepID=A0ACC2NY59_9HYME|nr:hypothetical protein QAD02_011015 [Eretmocerus hayati]
MSSSDVKKTEPTLPIVEVGTLYPGNMSVTHNWRLDESCLSDKSFGEKLISPIIVVSNRIHCRIWFYPRGVNENYKDFVSVYINLVKGDLETRLRFYLLNNKNEMINPKTTNRKHWLTTNYNTWGFPDFMKREYLTEDSLKVPSSGNPLGKTLTIGCDLIIDTSTQKDIFFEMANDERLREFDDFERLVDNEEFSDIILSMKGKTLHAHKSILANKSEVFAAMLTHNMAENQESCVDIEDVTCDVMKEVLRFMYSGKVNNLEDLSREIYLAADKYFIDGLKNKCERHLIKNISFINVFEYLNFAALNNAPILKDECMIFFKNNVKKVLQKSSTRLYDLDKDIIDKVCQIVIESLKD